MSRKLGHLYYISKLCTPYIIHIKWMDKNERKWYLFKALSIKEFEGYPTTLHHSLISALRIYKRTHSGRGQKNLYETRITLFCYSQSITD